MILENAKEGGDEEDVAAYLVEPLRSSVVQKYTGTFGASTAKDKLTSTILAFSHFVMEDTACLLAVADLQGHSFHFLSSCYVLILLPGSRHNGFLVLFDPMTHTIGGNSGAGDHGSKGIRETIESHTCNLLCQGLELSPVSVLLHTLDERIKEAGESLVSVSYGSALNVR
ncbi:kinase-like domain-containing protein [Mycena filopes]|nr:kinase-like domain-containing protein [Mycena filopes]